jgi:hypothetical protein
MENEWESLDLMRGNMGFGRIPIRQPMNDRASSRCSADTASVGMREGSQGLRSKLSQETMHPQGMTRRQRSSSRIAPENRAKNAG